MSIQQQDLGPASQIWQNPHHRIFKPHIGEQPRMALDDLHRKYTEITQEQCKLLWEKQYESSKTHCSHGPDCKHNKEQEIRESKGKRKRPCEEGMSQVKRQMLAGSLLPVWDCIAPHMSYFDQESKEKITNIHISRL